MTNLYVSENGVERPMTADELAAWEARTAAAGIAHSVEANVARAKAELIASDWAEASSVRSTKSLPRLRNGTAFDAYRSALRRIVLTKPEAVEEWPARPDADWVLE